MDEVLSRKALRHMLVRRRNERIAELRDDRWPLRLVMAPETLEELLVDSDPLEQRTLDFEGWEFAGIPLSTRAGMERGLVAVDWPAGVAVDGG